jgi:oxalate decarboxylase/phosphoglucose isomerase-like protein (cupin superfamily)
MSNIGASLVEISEIKEGDLVLARHVPAEAAWKDGLTFFSAGKELKAHIHNEVPREVLWTQEVIFVKKGKIRANIFNTSEEKVAEIEVNTGDIIILLRGGHGYDILEDGTQVLEVKNGPYVGPDRDRRRL